MESWYLTMLLLHLRNVTALAFETMVMVISAVYLCECLKSFKLHVVLIKIPLARADTLVGQYLFSKDFPEQFGSLDRAFSTMMLVTVGQLRIYSQKMCCQGKYACTSGGIFFISFYGILDLILLQVLSAWLTYMFIENRQKSHTLKIDQAFFKAGVQSFVLALQREEVKKQVKNKTLSGRQADINKSINRDDERARFWSIFALFWLLQVCRIGIISSCAYFLSLK